MPRMPRYFKYLLWFGTVFVVLSLGFAIIYQLFFSFSVPVKVINQHTAKPITSQLVTFRHTTCNPEPCDPPVLFRATTNDKGEFTVNKSQFDKAFVVEVDGFKTSNPFNKQAGSREFTHTYEDGKSYTFDADGAGLVVRLVPKGSEQ